MVTKTYLPSFLCDSSDGSDSSDTSDRSDSCDSKDSSDHKKFLSPKNFCDQKTLVTKKLKKYKCQNNRNTTCRFTEIQITLKQKYKIQN